MLTLPDLITDLRSLGPSFDPRQLAELAVRLRSELEGDEGRRALLLSTAESLPTTAGSSHRHPNGFDKLSLYRDPDTDLRLRLHIWWDGITTVGSSIHSHRWHLLGVVLCGTIQVTNYDMEPIDAPTGAPEEHLRVGLGDMAVDGSKTATVSGWYRAVPMTHYELGAGSAHVADAREPHAVHVPAGITAATLVVTAPPSRELSETYRRDPERAGAPVTLLERDDVVGLVRRLADHLAVGPDVPAPAAP